MIRVLIADDELPARQRLRQLLAAHPTCEIVAEAGTGTQTMELIAETVPDLLFLDIEMPDGSGLDVAASLSSHRPAIVFCTAYDQHAVDAFELAALDYLLKPVSRSRLQKTLSRLIPSETHSVECAPGSSPVIPVQHASRFLVRSGARYVIVAAESVLFFDSVDGLTRLTTDTGKQHWMDSPLHEIASRIDPKRFFRVSRAALVKMAAIAEIHPLPGGGASVLLRSGVQLDVSRRRVQDLLRLMESG